MEKTKVGVIGLGFIGPAHIEALRRIGTVDVVVVSDVSGAKEKAEQLGVPYAYENWKELLAHDGLEAVHICTPNNFHYEMSKAALEKGLHVVCDKPLAVSVGEATELVELARATGRLNALHFNVRYYPLIQQIRSMIKNGELGDIFAVNGTYLQDWLQKETDYSWRLDPKFSGESRAVADIGSHWFDAVEFMTGMCVDEVFADLATFYPIRKKPLKQVATYSGMTSEQMDYEDVEIKTEDYATVLFHMNRSVHGSMTVSQVQAGRKNRIYFEISGSKASVAFDTERPNELWIGKRDGNNEILVKDPSRVNSDVRELINYPGGHCEGFPDTSKQLFKAVYTALRNGDYNIEDRITYPMFKDGLREMKICESILVSSKTKSWAKV